jgi:hypothetical protein
VPLDEARLGGIGFDEWLRRRSHAASACSRVMSPFGTKQRPTMCAQMSALGE